MPDADVVVRGGTVVRPDAEPAVLDVAIADGLVAAVGPDLPHTGTEELDASGLHVLPGGVDPHVHLNDPGRADWEGFATGTDALAAGGFTTCVDMPLNSDPVTVDADAFDRKAAAARGTARIDVGLWGGLVPGRLDRLDELAARGVLGFKAFLCDSGLPEFPSADDLTLWEGMRRCADLGAIVLVHAENAAIVAGLAARAIAEGRTTARDFAASRPAVAEREAIARAMYVAGETGCAVHVVHVSTPGGVRLVEAARAAGVDASCETCPHYLLLTEDDLEPLGTVAKCAPPLRTSADAAGLWDLLASGELPMVASDHSPCPPERKRGHWYAAWGGIAGCQTTLQLLLEHGHARRGLPLGAVARLTSAAAAWRFGLAGKGLVEPGCDADLVILDLARRWELARDELRTRHRLSPFVGRPVRGRVERTILRGQTVWARGEPVGPPGGRVLRRATGVSPG